MGEVVIPGTNSVLGACQWPSQTAGVKKSDPWLYLWQGLIRVILPFSQSWPSRTHSPLSQFKLRIGFFTSADRLGHWRAPCTELVPGITTFPFRRLVTAHGWFHSITSKKGYNKYSLVLNTSHGTPIQDSLNFPPNSFIPTWSLSRKCAMTTIAPWS